MRESSWLARDEARTPTCRDEPGGRDEDRQSRDQADRMNPSQNEARRPGCEKSPIPSQRALQIAPNCLPRMTSSGVRRVVARLVHVSCSRSEVMLEAAAALIGRMARTASTAVMVRRPRLISDQVRVAHASAEQITEDGNRHVEEITAQQHDEKQGDRPAAQPFEAAP